jgi:hypothetical protein
MSSGSIDPATALADAVAAYRDDSDIAVLFDRLSVIADSADPEVLMAAVEPYRESPEVAGPVYERVVAARPTDARALVILANAYWLSGRGPDTVEALATRAIGIDPDHRGAWHLWALSERSPRQRVARWRQVSERFPADELTLAALADNAAALAGAEYDRDALALAIRAYESLLAMARRPEQVAAVTHALDTLRQWRL